MSRPVMLFAAGFGTRMGTLTRDCPKPLLKVGGETLLDRTLDLADAAGLGPKLVNAHYLADRIVTHLAGRDVAVAVEAPEILDTGGGLKAALPRLGAGPLATTNTDAVWRGPNPFTVLEEAWRDGMGALLLTVPTARAVGRKTPGDFALGPDGRLSRGGDFVYTGVQILDPAILDEINAKVFSLNRAWDLLAARGGLFGVSYAGLWCDVGHPEGIALAEAVLEGRDV
ncbi:nucleotidyltransferase family protein [Litorisediminicola beolgyonensis]|uniref:Nucleotidyltransferase family protein n=1 Tax=Litorisediminicola beolgyonensis TaxID=1173614 RepID=A0ABW3ZNX5_9RHOB